MALEVYPFGGLSNKSYVANMKTKMLMYQSKANVDCLDQKLFC